MTDANLERRRFDFKKTLYSYPLLYDHFRNDSRNLLYHVLVRLAATPRVDLTNDRTTT